MPINQLAYAPAANLSWCMRADVDKNVIAYNGGGFEQKALGAQSRRLPVPVL